MNAENRQELRALFDELLALPAEERAAFVDRRCADDPTLREELLSLLAAHDGAGDFLGGTRLGALGAELRRDAVEVQRSRIGPFRIVGVLGRGGMGVVYLAERDRGDYAQRVAIKVVSEAAGSAEVVRRFENERRLLAALDHSGIARILDGGTTEDGLPYFVMEFVEGRSIVEHAAVAELDLGQRLRLFLEVCGAVEHAHRRLIVHRDLKPANILVGADGRPRLLDFGIAKLLDDGIAPSGATLTAGGWMTPAYASPEQIRGEPTTTATDVYSLGRILYELLTGEAAFDRSASTPEERSAIQRVVLEGTIERPSTAVLRSKAGVRPEADRRRLARALRGDLDTIVLQAIAAEPERRYGSVSALSDEIRRHLDGLPVRARPASVGYRAFKFVRRHRIGVATAAAALTALLVGLGAAIFGLLRADRAESAALREAATAERTASFLEELFRISDPGEAQGNSVTAHELLDRGAARIGEELAGEPEVRGRLLRVMARAYGGLGLYAPQVATLEGELAVDRQLFGEGSAEAADTLVQLSYVEARRGNYPRALELAEQAVAILEPSAAADPIALANALSQAGLGHWYTGDLAAAKRALERSLVLREGGPQVEDADLIGVLNNIAILRWQLGELDEARPLYERALAISIREKGERHPSVAHTLNNLAILELQAKRLERARELHERALTIRRGLLAADHPDIAESLNNLGEVLRAAREFPPAKESFLAALAIREAKLGPQHPDVAVTLTNLGLTLIELEDLARARELLERALAVFGGALGEEHFHLSYPLAGLAQIQRKAGNLAESEGLYRRALALREKALGPGHFEIAELRRELASLLRLQGREAEAADLERVDPVRT